MNRSSENQKPLSRWQLKLHEIIYEADTPAGKWFDIILLLFIVASALFVMLESVKGLPEYWYRLFTCAEWVITILFTIEYILRIISIKKPKHYILSFYGLVDLVAIFPLYLSLLISGTGALATLRALRLLRVFRILKITRYIKEGHRLKEALRMSKPKIFVFLFAVLIISMIAGTLMYLIEGDESGFTSIPAGIYWCIVTLTTVGFGDITPVTPLGQFIASIIMIMGYGIIAVPTGIVSVAYAKTSIPEPELNTQSCPSCSADGQKESARYCWNCGYKLD
jgi:voltage-gated potassium channel